MREPDDWRELVPTVSEAQTREVEALVAQALARLRRAAREVAALSTDEEAVSAVRAQRR